MIDDYEKVINLIELGKALSEEIKPAAFEKNQQKVMARESRKSAVENNANSAVFNNSSDSNDCEYSYNEPCETGDTDDFSYETTEGNDCDSKSNSCENSPQTAWLPSSAQREDKSKYNKSKRNNPNMIDKSPTTDAAEDLMVENFSEELTERVKAYISYSLIVAVSGPSFADCTVKAIYELLTADKPVKLGACMVAPDVIKKTICYVNKEIIMQVSDKIFHKTGKIHNLPAYLKTAIFQQTCEYLMLPQNEYEFEGYAEMRDFYKTYLSL